MKMVTEASCENENVTICEQYGCDTHYDTVGVKLVFMAVGVGGLSFEQKLQIKLKLYA